ncbi:DNA repair protein [Colletotrichum karsti]|uniref:Protein artemis n=1 Tax=Colletotrichum karsti TaxID=1095194 RepID=A0A9P6HUC3_9PEZI|nr:DNA repair protein [Colletotrichum karsti]KAF9870873.1 DNA repair protein [Colletotrichum karsti]
MSTFNGLVEEFPDIRIDFFRKHADRRPPLACFLSHVHSDHLAGLESLRSPFVYCSAATREMLLRLERYPCRINYAKGILEARIQTYKHLKNLLKPLPLDTPTTLEFAPGSYIQVTLFDANHCPGSVMFLIEDSHHAILYTGDIRSEPWFVNALARNPAVVEYTCGIKKLDKIYLDTSFIQNIPFQTKADGIAELLRKVAMYPDDTVFHIQAWTYGYEQVWIALSKALRSRIHVDDYKMRMFSSLTGKASNDRFSSSIHLCPEAPALAGYVCGNTPHPGCLTRDEHVRLHSCERGNLCSVVRNSKVVFIQPVIANFTNGAEMAEVGIGGGGDDLERDAVLDTLSITDVDAILALVEEQTELSQDSRTRLQTLLEIGAKTGRNMSLDLGISSFGDKNEAAIVDAFRSIGQKRQIELGDNLPNAIQGSTQELPAKITFPYSRHSSYQELCDLVQIFRPQDIWPCTVNPADWIRDNITVRSLFGAFCSGDVFEHDLVMENRADRCVRTLERQLSQNLDSNQLSRGDTEAVAQHYSEETQSTGPETAAAEVEKQAAGVDTGSETRHSLDGGVQVVQEATIQGITMKPLPSSRKISRVRADAYRCMARNLIGGDWTPIGLLSTLDHHTVLDGDLGGI